MPREVKERFREYLSGFNTGYWLFFLLFLSWNSSEPFQVLEVPLICPWSETLSRAVPGQQNVIPPLVIFMLLHLMQ